MACYKLGVGDPFIVESYRKKKVRTIWFDFLSLFLQESFIDKEIERIRQIVGKDGEVVGAVSGGVDSTVAAKLMKEAIGDRWDIWKLGLNLHCLLHFE